MHLSATWHVTIGQARASAKGDLVIRCSAGPGRQMSLLLRLRANRFPDTYSSTGAQTVASLFSLCRLTVHLLRVRNREWRGKGRQLADRSTENPTVSRPLVRSRQA